MAETEQNFVMYAGNYATISFANAGADVAAAKWALADFPSKRIILSKSTEIGDIELLEGMMIVTLSPADTAELSGCYYHECLGLDSKGNPITMAVGIARIEPTVLKEIN